MSSRPAILGGLIFVFLIAAASPAAAQDWAAFAERSGRADDPLLVQALADGDFGERALICSGIGRRDDPYAADIVQWLLERNAGAGRFQFEILLRMLLQGLFDPARGDQRMRAAVTANAAALGAMIARIDLWTDPQLKSALVRLFPHMPAADVLPALLAVGSDLVHILESEKGLLPPQDMGLAMDYLAAVEALKAGDAFAQCAALARLSREKVLVDRARAVARAVAAD
jgi:hypothetical protein